MSIATVVTIVVTTVVTENRMPTHSIFFLMSDAWCQATIFFKNHVHFAHRAQEQFFAVSLENIAFFEKIV